jgi:hypothetical protein
MLARSVDELSIDIGKAVPVLEESGLEIAG